MWKLEPPFEERAGKLFIDGVAAGSIAEQFGTPCYVYSEKRIRENYQRLLHAFQSNYKNFKLFYAIKANNNLSVIKILRSEGCGADCSAPSEIFFARMAGFSPAEMLYTGNYNSVGEFEYAVESGATLNLDDVSHLEKILKISKKTGKLPPRICFRVNPGVGKGGFEQLVFAGPDAKFGVPADQVFSAYEQAKKAGFKRFGVHMMTGSNIREPEYFAAITEKLLSVAGDAAQKLGIQFDFVNIGGGFGVPYKPGEEDLDIKKTAAGVVEKFREGCEKYSLGEPELLAEPGRYLTADAGILLARVHSIKHAAKTFVGCDAGMNTLLRPAIYNAYHEILVDDKIGVKEKKAVNVCGPICENTDQFAKDRELPPVEEGDLLAVLKAGAYGFAMSSRYNSRPMCAEVLVGNGQADLIREAETHTDLLYRQRLPARLL